MVLLLTTVEARIEATVVHKDRNERGWVLSRLPAEGSEMITQRVACHVYEPDGTLLTAGSCYPGDAVDNEPVLILTPTLRGRVVHRCLLGTVRTVWVHLADGTLLPARVKRVYFDENQGRICVLAIGHAPRTEQPQSGLLTDGRGAAPVESAEQSREVLT